MRLIHTLLFLCVVVVLLAIGSICPAADQPNILWITCEDMSPTLGCWGDEYATTPRIDALAESSVRYTNAFATAPVCSPSRSCLITGCYATSLGTQRLRSVFPLPEEMTGFPAFLRKKGYFCTNNVKTDYNTSDLDRLVSESWDECSAKAHWRHRPDNKPFFAIFNDMVTHQSRTMVWPHDEFVRKLQSQLSPDEIHDPATVPLPAYYLDTPLIRKTVARYYDCVTLMDRHTGELLDQLKEDGLLDDTIVFFYSDHGSGMPRHKRVAMDSGLHVPLIIHFPEKYRHLASAKPGESIDRLVSFVDFGPTVLSLCGIEPPDWMQGQPFLGQYDTRPREYVYGARDRVDETYDIVRAVRNKEYLYVRNFMTHLPLHQPSAWPDQGVFRDEFNRPARALAEGTISPDQFTPAQLSYLTAPRASEELYDVVAAPDNLNNLVDSPEYKELLIEMRRKMIGWCSSTDDLGFIPESEVWRRIEQERVASACDLSGAKYACMINYMLKQDADHLARNLKNDDSVYLFWAAVGLSSCPEEAAEYEEELTLAMQDDSPAIRIEAANALARSGNVEKALPVLIESLELDRASAQLHAMRCIELLDRKAKAAEQPVRSMLDSLTGKRVEDEYIGYSGNAFLKRIASPQDAR